MRKTSLLMFGSQYFEVTYNSESLARSWCAPSFCLSPLRLMPSGSRAKTRQRMIVSLLGKYWLYVSILQLSKHVAEYICNDSGPT